MIKVYICASLRPAVYERVTEILRNLPPAIHLRPWGAQKGDRMGHVETDVAMINHADQLWLVGEYGRDCSWELGYAMGIGKPIKIFMDDSNASRIEDDWMLYHGLNLGLLEIIDLRKGYP